MTHKRLDKLKFELQFMSRVELIDQIWNLSSDEFETFEDLLQLAKETEHQLKQRLSHILAWYEYLAQ
jgi:hypothetical protein